MAEFTDITAEGIQAHRRLMAVNEDPGVCLVLCGRERQRYEGIVFCSDCSKMWMNRAQKDWTSNDWALEQRKIAGVSLWPEWV